jgi:hypothetical protein
VYSISGGSWTRIAELEKVRGSCAACEHNRRIYILGDESRHIELYNPFNGNMVLLKYTLPVPKRRYYGPQLLSYNEELIIFFNKEVGRLTEFGYRHVTMISELDK